MLRTLAAMLTLLFTLPAAAQPPLPATGISAADVIHLNALPRDAVSDRPIGVVDVGGLKVGVYGVFRPKASKQERLCTTPKCRRSTTC